jgi:hypothetical protein
MPPVENKLCDARQRKKAPQHGAFFFKNRQKESGDLRHVRSLRSFLSLHNLELNFVAFGE